MPTHEVTLDFNKSITLIQPEIIVRVGDADSQVIQATLYDDGIPYTPTGELRIQIERRDGGLIITRPMSTVSTNVYRATLPAVACAWHGESRQAYVAEYRDGKVYATSSSFKLKILPGSTTAEAIKFFDEELQEIRDLAGEAGSQITKNEEARQEAERTRAQAEQARKTAEESREEAESGRESAESSRESSERSRESAESSRKSAERTRESQESTRQSNESGRERAESSRKSAEQERSEAEQARESAETKREAYYTQLKSDVDAGEYDGATFTPSVDDLGNISWTNDRELPNPETKNITGPRGLTGDKGDTGDQGPKGDMGATFTPTVAENGDLTWENDKELENPQKVNIKGPKGDKGDIGEGLKVLGVYASLDEIKQHHESGERVGDAYMGGSHYYVWDGTEWQDAGELQGAKGDPGPAGADGEPGKPGEDGGYYTPSVSEEGILTWAGSKEGMPPIPEANIKGPAGEGSSGDYATEEEIDQVKQYLAGEMTQEASAQEALAVDVSLTLGEMLRTTVKVKITNNTGTTLDGIAVKTSYFDIEGTPTEAEAEQYFTNYKEGTYQTIQDVYGGSAPDDPANEVFSSPGWTTGTTREATLGSTSEHDFIFISHNDQLLYAFMYTHIKQSEKQFATRPVWYDVKLPVVATTPPKIEKHTRPDQVAELIQAAPSSADGDFATDDDIAIAKELFISGEHDVDASKLISVEVSSPDFETYHRDISDITLKITNKTGKELSGITVKSWSSATRVTRESYIRDCASYAGERFSEVFGKPNWAPGEARTATGSIGTNTAIYLYVYHNDEIIYLFGALWDTAAADAEFKKAEYYSTMPYDYTGLTIDKHTRPDQVVELVQAGGGTASVEDIKSQKDSLAGNVSPVDTDAKKIMTVELVSSGLEKGHSAFDDFTVKITSKVRDLTGVTIKAWYSAASILPAFNDSRIKGNEGSAEACHTDVFSASNWGAGETREASWDAEALSTIPYQTLCVYVYIDETLVYAFGGHWDTEMASPELEHGEYYYSTLFDPSKFPIEKHTRPDQVIGLARSVLETTDLSAFFTAHAQEIQDALNTLNG